MEEALAEGMLQEMVVTDFDEVDEHAALPARLVWDQDSFGRRRDWKRNALVKDI